LQAMFDALCPPDSSRPRRRLCVILVSQNTPYHDEPRQALRQFAQDNPYGSEKVRFMYIYKERQTDFVSALTSGEYSRFANLSFYVVCMHKFLRLTTLLMKKKKNNVIINLKKKKNIINCISLTTSILQTSHCVSKK
jgi:hypothetical protein